MAVKDREIAELRSNLFSCERFRIEDAASHIDDDILRYERIKVLESQLSAANERIRILDEQINSVKSNTVTK